MKNGGDDFSSDAEDLLERFLNNEVQNTYKKLNSRHIGSGVIKTPAPNCKNLYPNIFMYQGYISDDKKNQLIVKMVQRMSYISEMSAMLSPGSSVVIEDAAIINYIASDLTKLNANLPRLAFQSEHASSPTQEQRKVDKTGMEHDAVQGPAVASEQEAQSTVAQTAVEEKPVAPEQGV